jgi:nitrogen fixation protein NifU and related proteins
MNFEELYQDLILDHSKRPRNFGPLPDPTATARGDNPSCGDEIDLAVKLSPAHVEDIKFTGQGCAICMASASLMTIKVKGKPREEAAAMADAFRQMLTSREEIDPPDTFGDLVVFGAVRRFPQRVKCATLAWRALEQVLSSSTPEAHVTTEEGQ